MIIITHPERTCCHKSVARLCQVFVGKSYTNFSFSSSLSHWLGSEIGNCPKQSHIFLIFAVDLRWRGTQILILPIYVPRKQEETEPRGTQIQIIPIYVPRKSEEAEPRGTQIPILPIYVPRKPEETEPHCQGIRKMNIFTETRKEPGRKRD